MEPIPPSYPPAGYRIPPGVLLPSRRGAHCAPADEAPQRHHSQAETGSRMSRRPSGTTPCPLRRGGYQPPAGYRIPPAYCSPPAEAHTVRPQTKHPQAAIPKQKPAAGCPAGPPVQRFISSVGAAISRPQSIGSARRIVPLPQGRTLCGPALALAPPQAPLRAALALLIAPCRRTD